MMNRNDYTCFVGFAPSEEIPFYAKGPTLFDYIHVHNRNIPFEKDCLLDIPRCKVRRVAVTNPCYQILLHRAAGLQMCPNATINSFTFVYGP